MGVLCSSIIKEGHNPPTEIKPHTPAHQSHDPKSKRLHRMLSRKHSGKASRGWRVALDGGFKTPEAYEAARKDMQLEEMARAFDADVVKSSSRIEQEAVEIVKRIKLYDWEKTFGSNVNAPPGGKRSAGQHFLGSVDLINQTELFKVAKHMPKGSHLHIHFNSCLPAAFLIQQARNISAMYIRSTLSLTTPENMAKTRISFMVLTIREATHAKSADGSETFTPLGDMWDSGYISNTWMPYRDFQNRFKFVDQSGQLLQGTRGAEFWLESKMLISEEEAHSSQQTGRGIWEKFNYRTQMMKGLFAYESAFRNYTRACIEDFVADNIQYAEIRPNFMSTNSLKTDDGSKTMGNKEIMRIIDEELKITMAKLAREGKYFGGMKVIYCTPRIFKKVQIQEALEECISLKQKYKHLLCGFDLVGHEEMGNELRHFVPEFLSFQKKCKSLNLQIPFLFHCGETLEVGDKVDGNLFDAILLKSKRIGHGYALARHPLLMEIFKEKNIAVESCPISNEILGLTPVMAGHNLPILLANNVPCTINSDNATFYRSSLSHDFYQAMIGSESMNLLGWKQLAKWSLEHSCMDAKEMQRVTSQWEKQWNNFCKWIVDEYGSKFHQWRPSSETRKTLRLD